MIIEQAVLLTSGLGMRIEKISQFSKTYKNYLTVQPFLSNIIWNLKRHGIKKIILSIDYLANNLRNYYGDGSKFGGRNFFLLKKNYPLGLAEL